MTEPTSSMFKTSRVFIIEDDPLMVELLAKNTQKCDHSAEISHFANAYEAMHALEKALPDLILLDVLLDGPDGFTFLNELVAYPDTAKIPVIIISSVDFHDADLEHYGVMTTLSKDAMTPAEIQAAIRTALENAPRDMS